MYTYQDLLEVGENDAERMAFVRTVVASHKASEMYDEAETAREYDRHRNVTIVEYQKLLYTISGEAVPDNYSANYKLCSNFFNRFVTQQNQFLLGNGVSLSEPNEKKKLGNDFDTRLQEAGRNALVDGLSFGFWNKDHMEVFKLTEFAPLWDEVTGGLAAGIRFWQIDASKPFRATLYELDGYTEYIWRKDEEGDESDGEVLHPKRAYVLNVQESPVDGMEIIDGENYPSFPIVPLWGNPAHQSELVGIQEQIDAYDLIKSGFCNTVDDASFVYWTIQNAGGMDDIDLAKFVERMKTVKAAVVEDDGARAEQHTVDVPYASRETLLERLRSDLYDDYMALDTKNIAAGAVTATEIKAAYEPMNSKADMYEYCVRDFLDGIFSLAGIESEASFTRSMLVNTQEMVTVLLQAAPYLSEEYVTRKTLEVFGDGDKADEILSSMINETIERIGEMMNGEEEDNRPGARGNGTPDIRNGEEGNEGIRNGNSGSAEEAG